MSYEPRLGVITIYDDGRVEVEMGPPWDSRALGYDWYVWLCDSVAYPDAFGPPRFSRLIRNPWYRSDPEREWLALAL